MSTLDVEGIEHNQIMDALNVFVADRGFDQQLCRRLRAYLQSSKELAKANRSAGEIMRRARRLAHNPNMKADSLDGFMNAMDLGDPDPQNHRDGFNGADDIVGWFSQEGTDDWRQRD